MSHLEAAFDSTVDGKRFKKGDKLPLELANFPLAKVVKDSETKEASKTKEIPKPEIKDKEPKRVEPKKIIKKLKKR